MLLKIYKDDKFYLFGLLVYAFLLPSYLLLHEIFRFDNVPFLTEGLLFGVFVLLIISLFKDKNKIRSFFIVLLISGFVLRSISNVVNFIFSKSQGISYDVFYSRFELLPFIPGLFFVFSSLWMFYKFKNDEINELNHNSKLPQIMKRNLIANLTLFFLGLPLIVMDYYWLSYFFIVMIVNILLSIAGLLVSIIYFLKYRKSLDMVFINLIFGLIVFALFFLIATASIGV